MPAQQPQIVSFVFLSVSCVYRALQNMLCELQLVLGKSCACECSNAVSRDAG